MATGQFSGKTNPPSGATGKDPRAGSVALKDPRATASSRPVTVPTPQRPGTGGGGSKVVAIGGILVVILAIAGVAFAATSAHKEAAEQTQKEATVDTNNEILVKLSQMQASLNQLQSTVKEQDLTIRQLRSEVQSSRNSVDTVRSMYIQAQSTPLVNQAPKDPSVKGAMR